MRHEQGTTIIELAIALGILGIIAYLTSTFFTGLNQQDVRLQAEQTAGFKAKMISDLVTRDLRYVTTADSICDDAVCLDFTISRKHSDGSDYQVRYSSSCVDIPNLGAYNPTNSAFLFDEASLPRGGQCFVALQCQPTQYAQLNIRLIGPPAGVTLAAYQGTYPFPDLNNGATQRDINKTVTSAAICITPHPNFADKKIVHVDSAYLFGQQVRSFSNRTIFSEEGFANAFLLPNP